MHLLHLMHRGSMFTEPGRKPTMNTANTQATARMNVARDLLTASAVRGTTPVTISGTVPAGIEPGANLNEQAFRGTLGLIFLPCTDGAAKRKDTAAAARILQDIPADEIMALAIELAPALGYHSVIIARATKAGAIEVMVRYAVARWYPYTYVA